MEIKSGKFIQSTAFILKYLKFITTSSCAPVSTFVHSWLFLHYSLLPYATVTNEFRIPLQVQMSPSVVEDVTDNFTIQKQLSDRSLPKNQDLHHEDTQCKNQEAEASTCSIVQLCYRSVDASSRSERFSGSGSEQHGEQYPRPAVRSEPGSSSLRSVTESQLPWVDQSLHHALKGIWYKKLR